MERANRTEDRGSQEDQEKETETGQGLVSTKKQGSSCEKGQSDRSYNSESHDKKYHCVWSSDIDKWARRIYKKNFGEEPEGDITRIPAESVPDHDLLCAGFPCQSFSVAGKRKGFADTRGTLFFDICRILRAKRPSYCLLENVKGLLSHDEGKTFEVILESLDELGYGVQWQVLNSKYFGVPQNRERVFIVGYLREGRRPEIFPVREIIKSDINSNWEGCSNTLSGRSAGGMNWRGNYISSKTIVRRLTPIECERLQGFPDNWTKGVSDTQRYKFLGNAVTVNVIEFLGLQLKEELL